MHRRQFLFTAAASSIALAARAAEPPERKWRVVIVGSKGGYGHSLDSMWLQVPETEIVAASDPNPKTLEGTQQKLKIPQGFTDVRAIGEAKPELIAIGTTMGSHRDLVLAVAESGARGLYVEKPFCRTLAEADAILAACEKRGIKIAVAHRNRQHPTLPIVAQAVKDGAIGRLLELRGRGKEDQRGGLEDLWILGTHVLNLAVYFAGQPLACSGAVMQDGRPVTTAEVKKDRTDFGPMAGNEVHARFEMASGVPLFFDSVQNAGDRAVGFGLQLIGTKGIIDLRVDQTPLAHFSPGNPFQPAKEPRPWIPITTAGIGQPEPIADLGRRVMSHATGARDLISAIQEKRAPLCSGADGRLTVEMVTAILASQVRAGERVAFPLSVANNPLGDW